MVPKLSNDKAQQQEKTFFFFFLNVALSNRSAYTLLSFIAKYTEYYKKVITCAGDYP